MTTEYCMSIVSNTRSSGRNVTTVPCLRVRPISVSGYFGFPETILPSSFSTLSNSMRYARFSWYTATCTQRDRALTTDAPTPCRPPEYEYAALPNLPPACSCVKTTSTPETPSFS